MSCAVTKQYLMCIAIQIIAFSKFLERRLRVSSSQVSYLSRYFFANFPTIHLKIIFSILLSFQSICAFHYVC